MERRDMLEIKIDVISKNVDEIKQDVSKIKDAIYEPDCGLFMRVHKNTEFRKRRLKIDWLIITASVGVLVNVLVSLFFGR